MHCGYFLTFILMCELLVRKFVFSINIGVVDSSGIVDRCLLVTQVSF